MAKLDRDVRVGKLSFSVTVQTLDVYTHCMVSDHPGAFDRLIDEVQNVAEHELIAAAEKLKDAKPNGSASMTPKNTVCAHCGVLQSESKTDRCPIGPLQLHTWNEAEPRSELRVTEK